MSYFSLPLYQLVNTGTTESIYGKAPRHAWGLMDILNKASLCVSFRPLKVLTVSHCQVCSWYKNKVEQKQKNVGASAAIMRRQVKFPVIIPPCASASCSARVRRVQPPRSFTYSSHRHSITLFIVCRKVYTDSVSCGYSVSYVRHSPRPLEAQ